MNRKLNRYGNAAKKTGNTDTLKKSPCCRPPPRRIIGALQLPLVLPVCPRKKGTSPAALNNLRCCPAVDNRAFQYDNTRVTLAEMRKDASTYSITGGRYG